MQRSLRLIGGSAAAIALSATAAPLGGQARPDAATRDSAVRAIEPVVVRGIRMPAVVGGAGAVVAEVDSMPLPAAPFLDQALRELPFVLVRRNSRGEMELSVRGSDSRQAAVLVDGVPLTIGWDHRSDPSVVPLTGARSITLVRGLSSLLYGPNVLGGVVDVGLSGGPAGGAAPGLALATDVDQFGGTGVSLGGGDVLAGGRLTLRGGVGYRDRPGFALGADVADLGRDRDLRTNSDVRHLDGFASLRYEGRAGGYGGVSVSAFQAERGVPPELHVEEPRLWRYPDQRRLLAVATAGTGVRPTPWGHGALQASLGVNAGSVEIETYDTPSYEQVVGRETGDERTLTARLLGEHSLVGGATLRAAATIADVTYDEGLDDDPSARYRQRLWSVGSELSVPVGPDIQLAGGLVADGADTPEAGGREPLGRRTRWGGRLGLTASAPGDVRLHASASQRSRFPALRELYSGALDRFEPNPGLRPETLFGVEAGATKRWSRFELQGVAFQHRLRDAVVRTTLPSRKFRRENRNEIRSTGVELLGGWRHPSGVSLLADLTAQRVRLVDVLAGSGEQHAEHQPELRAGLDLGVPLPLDVRGAIGVRHTGRQYCVNPDLGAQEALGSQTSGDVQAERSWPLGRAASSLFRTLRLRVSLENLSDAAVYDQCGLPQPGRTARVTMELR